MKTKAALFMIILILGGLLSAGCGSAASPSAENEEPTPIPTVIADSNIVAEGRVVPRESVQLAFFTNGQVIDILIEEGDQVQAGDVVAILGDREAMEASIANAQAELLAAQQAMDTLNDNLDVARVDAVRAIAAANRAVRDADYQLNNYTIPSDQVGLTALEAVVVMKERLDKASEAFEPYKHFSSGNSTRKELKEDLDETQSDYNAAVKRLEYETAAQEAQTLLDKAIADFETLSNGPDPDDISAVESRIAAAEANLKAAEAALSNLELTATIDGTVVTQDLIIGQLVTAGQPVMMITDFSQMYVETNDLTEIEVVNISVGQKVKIITDALPEIEMSGRVEKISDVFEEKRGDITYTVRILIDDFDPHIRWGMTAVITFEK